MRSSSARLRVAARRRRARRQPLPSIRCNCPRAASPLAAREPADRDRARRQRGWSRSASAATSCSPTTTAGTGSRPTVPVSADLVAVQFPSAQPAGPSATTAWCCTAATAADTGRASSTGGRPRAAGRALRQARGRATPSRRLRSTKRSACCAEGPELPLLDVWFDDERNGYVVGAFGLMLRAPATAARPGARAPTASTTRRACTCTRCAAAGGELYIVGELGLLLQARPRRRALPRRCRRLQGHAVRPASASPTSCSRYGLRGNAWRSRDARQDAGSRSRTGVRTGPDRRGAARATAASRSSARTATCWSAATTAPASSRCPSLEADAAVRRQRAPATAPGARRRARRARRDRSG